MKLADFIADPNATIDKAFEHPVMKIRPRAANPNPTYEDAVKATVNAIEYEVMYAVAARLSPALQEALDNQILIDGEHADADDKDAWESALDDAVEEAIEEYVPILSADWLGTHTINTDLFRENGVEKFAQSLGREVYRQLTFAQDKSPAKIMSAAGIGGAILTERLNQHIAHKEENPMTTDTDHLEKIMSAVLEHVGKDFDILTVYDDLDQASDDDALLAEGAAARLGIGPEDLEPLQDMRLLEGDETPQKLVDMLTELASGAPKKPAAKKAAAKKTAAKKTPAAKKAPAKSEPVEDAAAEAEGSGLTGEHIGMLKEACTFKDADMAVGCGVSRATFNNWANGKTEPDLTGEQYQFLRGEIVGRVNTLLAILTALDGTEYDEVF